MNLKFRNITEDDLELIMNWRTMPEVSKYMYSDFEPDMQKQKEWFTNINQDQTRLDWIISVDNEDIGFVSLTKIDRKNNKTDWAYYLGSTNVRGKGYGRNIELNILEFVFEKLNFNKLCCEVFSFNEIVVSIHKKYGSKVEGNRRQQIFKNGEYYDIVEMGILKSDYFQNVKGKFEYFPAEFEPLAKEVY